MSDPLWTAQIDQMVAGARDLAKATAAYYKSLIDEGITEQVAVPFTMGWVSAVLSMPPRDEEE